MKNKKSQGAVEFLILTAVIIFFFTLFFVSLNENMGDKIKQKQNLAIEEIAIYIQDEINLASKSSEGYSRKFKIPDDINGENYEISITSEMIYAKSSDKRNAIALPIPSISGNIVKGENLIKKQGGKVYLNP